MPASTVHAGFALLVAAGLLADAYDRKALAVVLAILALAEVDAILGWWIPGAHRAATHNLLLPVAAGALLYYDVRLREESWLRERGGDWAVRVAWVALFVHTFAHVLLDWAHLDGINLFYPVADRFYRLEGELALSASEGLVQTFVEIDLGEDEPTVDAGGGGTTDDTHVSTPADPDPDADPADEDVERIVPIAVDGWQLYLIVVGLFTVAARRLQGEPLEQE